MDFPSTSSVSLSNRYIVTPRSVSRGRFELPSLMPRSSVRSHDPKSDVSSSTYLPRPSRSTSGSRYNMANGRSSYGSSSNYGTGTSGYGTGTSSYTSPYSTTSGNSSLYSPRSSGNYTSTSNYPTSSSYLLTTTAPSSYSSSYIPSHRTTTTNHSSYYTPTASTAATSSPTGLLSPTRSKSPVKEDAEQKEQKASKATPPAEDSNASTEPQTPQQDRTAGTARRRFRHSKTASGTHDSEDGNELPRLPSLNEPGAAASMSKDLRECLREEFLLCKICFDVFKNPKSLPCLHTFCLECLNKYMDGYRFDTRKFCCPICRRQIYMPKEGAEGFPDSFFVERLRDVLSRRTDDTDCHICNFRGQPCPAKVFCLECKTNLCNECGNGHRENKVTAKHSLLILADDCSIQKVREHCCEKHSGEPVCFFCIECRRPICLACTVMDHANHNVEAIQEVRQEFIKDCQGLIQKAEKELGDLGEKRKKLYQVEKEVVDKKESVKTEINAVAESLINLINKQKAALLEDLDKMFDFGTIHGERERIDATVASLQSAVEDGRKVLSRDLEPIEQLKAKGQTLTTLEDALHFEPYNAEAFNDRSQLAVQFFSGESEIRLGRLVRTILPSEGSTHLDPVIEYKPAENGDSMISTSGGSQTFIIKDDVRKQLRSIDALSLLPNGELVVLSSTSERRVQIFDMAGMLKNWFPQRSSKLAQPSSMCIWDGQIAVTDMSSHAVHVFDHQGHLNHVFGAGVLDRPWAITATTNGSFVIADPGKTRLTIHSNLGDLLNVLHFQKKTSVPRFLATCGNTIYSVNQSGDDIKAWRFNENNLRLLGVIKVASAAAAAIPLASTSNLSSAIASSGSHQSLPLKQTSSVSSASDIEELVQSRSGSISSSTAPAPFTCAGLFADKEGNLFVTDRSTSSVAVFTALSETYMIQLSPNSPSRPSAIVVTPDDRIIVAQSKADETISGLVEAITGDALNMELVSYTLG